MTPDEERRCVERRAVIDSALHDIRDRLDQGDRRMQSIESCLSEIQEQQKELIANLAGFPRHIAAWCKLAESLNTLMHPVMWAFSSVYRALLVLGGGSAAAYGIWMFLDRVSQAAPWW